MAFIPATPSFLRSTSSLAQLRSRPSHSSLRTPRRSVLRATAAPTPTPTPTPPPAAAVPTDNEPSSSSSRGPRLLMLVTALAAALAQPVLPRSLPATSRVALTVLGFGVSLVTWWLTSGASMGKRSGETVALPARSARASFQLPFADRRFWDFTTFPLRRIFPSATRAFTPRDTLVASVLLFLHAVALLAPFTVTPSAVLVFLALHCTTGMLGITFAFHRLLSHRSFSVPKFIEYPCAYLGVLALQGDPMEWVSMHRHHHRDTDGAEDPHSPLDGFWHSHFNWMVDEKAVVKYGDESNVPDLEKQRFYRWMKATYPIHPIALAVALYAVGGLPWLVWGVALRTVTMWHVTWLVNSASHVWGFQSFNTGDISMNNWWVGVLAFGEGWHNNHHAFEDSARHGLEWWQWDPTWYMIAVLRWMGLAKNVRLPSEKKRAALAIGGGNGVAPA